jgi:hypothetical protein
MNGLLYPQPQGSLMDPRAAMLTQMGLGMMAGSGPSRMPVSFGQTLGQAGMQGVQAGQQAIQAQQQEAFRQAQMKKMEEQLQLQVAEAARKQNLPVAHGPGTQLFRPGEDSPYYTVPFRPADPAKPQPPMTRKVRIGEDEVTQEYVDGKWSEVGRGPAFARSVVPAPTGAPMQQPKPPPGFRYKADNPGELEPIPGGPKDTTPKDNARAAGAVQKADIVIGKVDEALKNVGFGSTGLTGTVLGMVPGTKAYDLDKTIDTIKGNLGFSELQAMREASPTGGALGQVAIQELAMLQSTVASLEKGQSEAQLRRSLEQVRKHFQNWKNAVQQSQAGVQPTPPTEAPKRRVYDLKSGTFK